ncbi:MAG TPA: Gfo/Idh/MocA family oxidoreductase [Bryobacteraceae bacterium]|nr:Gfo/Idh/MocA family oxidoreductase [Bryobacteraceae bacterium]
MSVSRRHFISGTGLALGQTALAQNTPKISPNNRIQLGCIGFGIMGQGDVKTAVGLPGVELVGVADVYDGRRTLAKERYGDQVFTTRDYRELLARPGLDAVIVATPDHWHARIASDAMLAGKDVYCQKPMVQKVEDGHLVIDTQKKTNRILQVGSQRVSSILYAKTRELIKSGVIGNIHLIEAFWNRNSPLGAWQYSVPPDASPETIDWDRFLGSAPKHPFEPVRLFRWRNYRDYGTGIAGDLFVHQFSGIHFVMNSIGPQRVVASGGTYYWKDGRDVPDLMMGMYDYPKTEAHAPFQINLRVNFEAGGTGSDGAGFRFVGTEGILNLSVGNSVVLSRRPRNVNPGTTAETFSKAIADKIREENRRKYPKGDTSADSLRPLSEETFVMPEGYSEQVAHHQTFFNAVRSRKPVVEDAVFGLRAAGPALLSNVSYFEQRMVEWDPVNMRIKSGS